MARMPRLAVAGQPHLVVQRGRAALPVFRDDADRIAYLAAACEVARAGTVAVHAYVLLDDAVMLLVTPRASADLGKFMQRVNRRYVPVFHRRHGGNGSLWAGRFQAAAIEAERYLFRCILLIEQAPVRAGSAASAVDWTWSSARHHVGKSLSPLVMEHADWWQSGNTPFEREARHEVELQRMLSNEQVSELLRVARGGWPLGSAAFVGAASRTSVRQIAPRPRGRPRRTTAKI